MLKFKKEPRPKCSRVKNPCKICFQTVTPKTGLRCEGACKKWAHFTCLNYTPGKILDIKYGYVKVSCPCPDCDTDPKETLLYPKPKYCGKAQCPASKYQVSDISECLSNVNLSEDCGSISSVDTLSITPSESSLLCSECQSQVESLLKQASPQRQKCPQGHRSPSRQFSQSTQVSRETLSRGQQSQHTQCSSTTQVPPKRRHREYAPRQLPSQGQVSPSRQHSLIRQRSLPKRFSQVKLLDLSLDSRECLNEKFRNVGSLDEKYAANGKYSQPQLSSPERRECSNENCRHALLSPSEDFLDKHKVNKKCHSKLVGSSDDCLFTRKKYKYTQFKRWFFPKRIKCRNIIVGPSEGFCVTEPNAKKKRSSFSNLQPIYQTNSHSSVLMPQTFTDLKRDTSYKGLSGFVAERNSNPKLYDEFKVLSVDSLSPEPEIPRCKLHQSHASLKNYFPANNRFSQSEKFSLKKNINHIEQQACTKQISLLKCPVPLLTSTKIRHDKTEGLHYKHDETVKSFPSKQRVTKEQACLTSHDSLKQKSPSIQENSQKGQSLLNENGNNTRMIQYPSPVECAADLDKIKTSQSKKTSISDSNMGSNCSFETHKKIVSTMEQMLAKLRKHVFEKMINALQF